MKPMYFAKEDKYIFCTVCNDPCTDLLVLCLMKGVMRFKLTLGPVHQGRMVCVRDYKTGKTLLRAVWLGKPSS